jgi:hypothetical protein
MQAGLFVMTSEPDFTPHPGYRLIHERGGLARCPTREFSIIAGYAGVRAAARVSPRTPGSPPASSPRTGRVSASTTAARRSFAATAELR